MQLQVARTLCCSWLARARLTAVHVGIRSTLHGCTSQPRVPKSSPIPRNKTCTIHTPLHLTLHSPETQQTSSILGPSTFKIDIPPFITPQLLANNTNQTLAITKDIPNSNMRSRGSSKDIRIHRSNHTSNSTINNNTVSNNTVSNNTTSNMMANSNMAT